MPPAAVGDYAVLLQRCVAGGGRAPAGSAVHARAITAGLSPGCLYLSNILINFYSKTKCIDYARKVFDEMPHRNIVSFNTLLSLYAKAGYFKLADQLFTSMPERDSVSWTTMIVGYNKMGWSQSAVRHFREMVRDGTSSPTKFTLTNVLCSCIALGKLDVGRTLHGFVVKLGFSGVITVVDSLLNMYGKCGDKETAEAVFNSMPERSVSSWNVMVSMYAQMGQMNAASAMFEGMTERNIISWNAIVAGYNQNGMDREALAFFSRMTKDPAVPPDEFTATSALSACANLGMVRTGKEIHGYILRTGMPRNEQVGNALISMYAKSNSVESAQKVVDKTVGFEMNVVSHTALLEGYVKIGSLEPAREIFDAMSHPDVVAWTLMIVGYEQNGLNAEAIELFRMMVEEGPAPNSYTLAAVLSACASLATIGLGRQVHCKAIRSGEAESASVSNAVINMYARCGSITLSRRVFDNLRRGKETVTWTSMIIALAQHGQGEEAVDLFDEMLGAGVKPDHITYVGVISACVHAGLVDRGKAYFKEMQDVQKIAPTLSHYACMIDLIARAGLLTEAREFIDRMPVEPDAFVWGSLLSACKAHKNADLAEIAAERLLAIDPENGGAYSALANVFSACGRWKDAAKTWKTMRDKAVKKEQGSSWIFVRNTAHVFAADDSQHPQRAAIYEKAAEVWAEIKKAGFVPDLQSVLHDVEDELKEELLSRHSEKLAIAFGLLSTPEGTTLTIMKNLRVCNDCHSAIKFISAVAGREIVVRDATRFHHFRDGRCSCRDFW